MSRYAHIRRVRTGRARSRRPSARRGFSFVELLFAIAVMGIGFIMLAAMFPVGLQQTKLTLDETTAAGNARGTVARMVEMGQVVAEYGGAGTGVPLFGGSFPNNGTGAVKDQRYNGVVRTFNDPRILAHFPLNALTTPPRPVVHPGPDLTYGTADDLRLSVLQQDILRFNEWKTVSQEIIQPTDSRLATTVMFKRDAVGVETNGVLTYAPASTAQIIAINAQVANGSEFAATDVLAGNGVAPLASRRAIYNLEPRPVAVQICQDTVNGTYVATFFSVRRLNGPGLYNRGGYPTGTDPDGQNWDSVFDEAVNAVAEGSFVVISDDRVTAPANGAGRMNGRIFRLGVLRADKTDLGAAIPYVSFDLAPGYGFTNEPGNDGAFYDSSVTAGFPGSFKDDILAIGLDRNDSASLSNIPFTATPNGTAGSPNADAVVVAGTAGAHGAVALVLGKGFSNAALPTPNGTVGGNTYTGLAMDIAAYTTFIPVLNP